MRCGKDNNAVQGCRRVEELTVKIISSSITMVPRQTRFQKKQDGPIQSEPVDLSTRHAVAVTTVYMIHCDTYLYEYRLKYRLAAPVVFFERLFERTVLVGRQLHRCTILVFSLPSTPFFFYICVHCGFCHAFAGS